MTSVNLWKGLTQEAEYKVLTVQEPLQKRCLEELSQMKPEPRNQAPDNNDPMHLKTVVTQQNIKT